MLQELQNAFFKVLTIVKFILFNMGWQKSTNSEYNRK